MLMIYFSHWAINPKDGSAAWRAGNQFRLALIGQGVSASHGSERTHKRAIEATIDLCMAYIENM